MEVIFGLFVIVFIIILVRNIAEWAHNNGQPQVPAQAQAVSKRRSNHHHNHNGHMHVSHSYHVTFEYSNGERTEATVKRTIYNEIHEGDQGTLTMQGTRFISFER